MFSRKRRKKMFVFKNIRRAFTIKGRRTITIGDEDFYVFKCGDETVVYKRDKVVFNSVLSEITYKQWLHKKKFGTFN